MAKTYEELLEQAAIIRDETAAGKNTAERVGGTITDAIDYVKELKDTYAGIHAEAADAKETATAAKTKNAEQDGKISSLEDKDATHDTKIAKLEERVIQYLYPKIYQLNEGAGAIVFHGFYKGSASVSDERKTASEEGYSYKVVFKSGSFYLQEISPEGVTVLYSSWDKISLPKNKIIESSESYAQRDCLYYIYVEGEGSTYYYIDSNGVASEKSATYLLRMLANKNAAAIAKLQGNDAAQDGEIATLHEHDTAIDGKISALEAKDIEHNAAIVRKATVEYYDHSVTDGPSRINTRATFKFFGADNNQLFMATLFGAGDGYPGLLSLKNKTKLDGYADTFSQNPAASSESNGLMSAEDKRKLDSVASDIQDNSGLIQENQSAIAANTQEIARVSSTAAQAVSTAQEAKDTAEAAKSELVEVAGSLGDEDNRLNGLIAENKTKIASVESTATQARDTAVSAQTAAETAQNAATAAQTKNTEQDARLEKIENIVSPLSTAGRYWNEANGTPTAAGHYGSLDALRSLPEMLGLGRYLVKDDRTRRKLDPKDSTKYADDGTDAKLDGTEGQCMWCWNGFYANVWKEGDKLFKVVSFDRPVGNDISIWIPAGGISWLGAGVMDRGDAPYTDKTKWKLCSVINNSEQFRGGAGKALDASKYSKAPADTTPQITMLGMPTMMMSTTQFGDAARNRFDQNGNVIKGWEANWFVARFVVEFLFEIIMGTENSQEAFNNLKDANGLYQGGFGTGVTDMPEWGAYNGSYPVIPTSVGLEAGDGVCLVPYSLPNTGGAEGAYHTFNVPVFFGLVGAGFGHLWQWVRGIIIDVGEEQSQVYVAPSMYADYYPNTVEDKIMVAECPRVSGWIMRKSYRGLCCIPTKLDGSNTLRYSDYFSTSAEKSKGLRVCASSGRAIEGLSAGASYAIIDHIDTSSYVSCSTPLCYFTEDPKIPLSQSIANNS